VLVVGCSGGALAPGGDGGVAGDGGQCPTPDAITGRVIARVYNATASDVWLATEGEHCDTMSVASGGVMIDHALQWQCTCECAAPRAPAARAYHRLAPGEKFDLSWDALRLEACTLPVDCSTYGWKDLKGSTTTGVARRLAPGRYEVRVGYETTLPGRCTAEGDTARCGEPSYGSSVYSFGARFRGACPAASTAKATFDLSDGDNVVPIEVR
jgi:hypothetical protein